MAKRIVVLLLAIFLLSLGPTGPTGPLAQTLAEIDAEAKALEAELRGQQGVSADRAGADLLFRAAATMREDKDCRTALALYRKAMSLNPDAGANAWILFTDAAACVKEWSLASRAARVAVLRATDDNLRGQGLTWLGHALESRSGWNEDWRSLALGVYEESLTLRQDAWTAKRVAELRDVLAGESELRIKSSSSNEEGETPRICISFNTDLADPVEVLYGDYVRFVPAFKATFSVNDDILCAAGAAFGTSYTVSVRKGLASADRVLVNDATLTVVTGHRDTALWFDRSAYVLPAGAQNGVALHSINAAKAEFELHRIHERNILGDFVRNSFRTSLSGYDLERVAELHGQLLYRGEVVVGGPMDQTHISSLRLPADLIAQPGLYVLAARAQGEETSEWEERATQWLVVTDLGLTTYNGNDGLTVICRSLADGKPLAGVESVLYGRNNEPLGRAMSDGQGLASFAAGLLRGKGGRTPLLLSATHPDRGFSFLHLDQAPYDLSDRGVSGRTAPGPLDAFVYTERGVYRPGETVNMVALLRDGRGTLVNGPPLTLRLVGPDGDPVLERVLKPGESGAYGEALTIAKGARTGSWTVELRPEPETLAGSTAFMVEAILPPRMEAGLDAGKIIAPGAEAAATLTARYFFGAPAADCPVSGEMKVEQDPEPFGNFKDFVFTLADTQVDTVYGSLAEGRTDAEGRAVLPLDLPELPDTPQPLRTILRAEVLDVDGRVAVATATAAVRQLDSYAGIRPLFADDRAEADAEAGFEVVLVDGAGVMLASDTQAWRLVRVERRYQWFRRGSSWDFEPLTDEEETASGSLALDGQTPGRVAAQARRGEYRLELLDDNRRPRASYAFIAGEQIGSQGDTPDMVRVELDKASYRSGESAKLHLRSPWAGEGSVVMASEGLHEVHNFSLAGNETELEIPVRADWGGGVYALVTVYRPASASASGADRAVGIIWLAMDRADKRLDLDFELPEVARPGATVDVPVSVAGAEPGDQVYLTLAAVDEALLRLTDYTTPDPLDYFLGKRRLGLELRDLYGRLISGEGQPLALRQGGDGFDESRGMVDANVELLSLFSGVVRVGEDGRAVVALDLPEFNGQARLMAVAWNRARVGFADSPLLVRDKLVISPSLPRFLALGDRSELRLLLHNVEGAAGPYRFQLKGEGAVALQGKGEIKIELPTGKQSDLAFALRATGLGKGSLHLVVDGPGDYHAERDLVLNVRGRELPRLFRAYHRIEPGQSLPLKNDLIKGLDPGGAVVKVGVSGRVNLDVGGLLAELDRYPYGCLEQVTSRAMPLLHANALSIRWGLPVDPNLDDRVVKAIDAILAMQRGDGAFGLWSNYDDGESWLSAYAMDFLTRARIQGHVVPDYFYDRGLANLARVVGETANPEPESLTELAYCHYVLALAGQGRPEDARYLFDNSLAKFRSPLAVAQLAAGLAMQGEVERGRKGFSHALFMPNTADAWQSYGSALRDLAGIISVLADTGQDLADPAEAWQRLVREMEGREWFSTQEQAWLILAAGTLSPAETMRIARADGVVKELKNPLSLHLDADLLAAGDMIRNLGDAPVWAAVTVMGTRLKPEPVAGNGFELKRTFHDLEGKPLDPAALAQGQMVVVLLKGRAQREEKQRILVIDLLPAGLEMENPGLVGARSLNQFQWLPELSMTRFVDGLDDRFVAAVDIYPNKKEDLNFTVAYLARAVTPGAYALPAATVEDMYQPRWRATAGSGTVKVIAR